MYPPGCVVVILPGDDGGGDAWRWEGVTQGSAKRSSYAADITCPLHHNLPTHCTVADSPHTLLTSHPQL